MSSRPGHRSPCCRPFPLPPGDVPGALPRLLVSRAWLAADGLAIGLTPGQPRPDPLAAPGRLALGHPAGERDQDVLHLRGAVQPALLDRHHDAAALAELPEDAERVLGALANDPVEGPHDQHLELARVRVVERPL